MMRNCIFLFVAALSGPALFAAETLPATNSLTELPRTSARKNPPVIILKFDDVKQVQGKAPDPWVKLADYLSSRRIKGGFGMVCATLAEAQPEYVRWVQQHRDSGLIEFWFHGWDHATHEINGTRHSEFSHRSYAEQKRRFDDSQRLAREKLGFAFETFGTPGGGSSSHFDDETIQAVAGDPDIKVWLYPTPLDPAGKTLAAAGKVVILDRVFPVNLEASVGVPGYERFVKGYAQYPDREYFVLQGHPAMWNAERFTEFTRIIDFLVQEKAVFLRPSEYAGQRRKTSTP